MNFAYPVVPSEPRVLEGVRCILDGLLFPEGPVALSDGSIVVMEMDGGRIRRVTRALAMQSFAI